MVDQVKQSIDIFGTALDSTEEILKNMNSTIVTNANKASLNMFDLGELLNQEAENEIEETEEHLKAATSVSGLAKVLFWIACVEILMFVVFILFQYKKTHENVF